MSPQIQLPRIPEMLSADSRLRDFGLMMLGLPGLAAPWAPFGAKDEGFVTVAWSIADFMRFENPFEVTWSQKIWSCTSALPYLLPFAIVLWQTVRLFRVRRVPDLWTSISCTLAALLITSSALIAAKQLPESIRFERYMTQVVHSPIPLVNTLLFTGVFVALAALAGFVTVRTWRERHSTNPILAVEPPLMLAYVFVAVPLCLETALATIDPASGHFPVLGTWLLLWTSAVYVLTSATRMVELRRATRYCMH